MEPPISGPTPEQMELALARFRARSAYENGYGDGVRAALMIFSMACLTVGILYRLRDHLYDEPK
jgi:hypothetical protein